MRTWRAAKESEERAAENTMRYKFLIVIVAGGYSKNHNLHYCVWSLNRGC